MNPFGIGGDDGDADSVASSIWDATEQTAAITQRKWAFIFRLVPDAIFIGLNIVSLLYVVTFNDITPGKRLGNFIETSIAFLGGFGGFLLVYAFFRACFSCQSAYSSGDFEDIVKSSVGCGKWSAPNARTRQLKREWSEMVGTRYTSAGPKKSTQFFCRIAVPFNERMIRLRRRLNAFCTSPPYALTAMSWNIMWCATWALSTEFWKRGADTQKWDFNDVPTVFYIMQSSFLIGLTMDICLKFVCPVDLSVYLFSIGFIVDLVISPPVLLVLGRLEFAGGSGGIAFAQYLLFVGWVRWIRAFVVVRFISSFVLAKESATLASVFNLLLGLLVAIVAFASAMFTAEAIDGQTLITFVYFALITLSTVGYGDIFPHTTIGQLITVVFVVAILLWLPSQISLVIESLNSAQQQYGSLPTTRHKGRFVILCGDVSPEQLSLFMYDVVRLEDSRSRIKKVLVLTQRSRSHYSKQTHEARVLQLSLCIKGGELGINGDPEQERKSCIPHLARAIFLLSDCYSDQWILNDRQTVTRLLGLRKLGVNLRKVSVQLQSDTVTSLVRSLGVADTVALSNFKMALLARSCSSCPGLSTLITNLLGSTYPIVTIGSSVDGQKSDTARLEYLSGSICCCRRFLIPSFLENFGFLTLCENLYERFNIILIAVERPQWNQIYLNPITTYDSDGNNEFSVRSGDWAIIITRDTFLPTQLSQVADVIRRRRKLFAIKSGFMKTWKRGSSSVQMSTNDDIEAGIKNNPTRKLSSFKRERRSRKSTRAFKSRPKKIASFRESNLMTTKSLGVKKSMDIKQPLEIKKSTETDIDLSLSSACIGKDFGATRSSTLESSRIRRRFSLRFTDSQSKYTPTSRLWKHSKTSNPKRLNSKSQNLQYGFSRTKRQMTKGLVSRIADKLGADQGKMSLLDPPDVEASDDEASSFIKHFVYGKPELKQHLSSGLDDDPSNIRSREDLPGTSTFLESLKVESYIEAREVKWKNRSLPFILVCGWNKGFHSFVYRIVSEGQKFNVLVLRSSDLTKYEIAQLKQFSDMFAFIKGRPIIDINLLKAGVLEARHHLILSSDLDVPITVEEVEDVQPDSEEVTRRRLQGDRDAVIVNFKIRQLLEHARRVKEKRKYVRTIAIRQHSEPRMDILSNESTYSESCIGCPTFRFQQTATSDSTRLGIESSEVLSQCKSWELNNTGIQDENEVEKVILDNFSDDPNSENNGDDVEDCLADYPNKVLTEVSDIRHIYFLDTFDFQHSTDTVDSLYSSSGKLFNSEDFYQYSPDFACGRVFSDSLLYRLIAQSPMLSEDYADPRVFRLLIGSGSGQFHSVRDHNIKNGFGLRAGNRGLQLIPSNVLSANGEFFSSLFSLKLKENIIIIGLFRKTTCTDYKRYVYTCPTPRTKVYREDKLYVLEPTMVETYRS